MWRYGLPVKKRRDVFMPQNARYFAQQAARCSRLSQCCDDQQLIKLGREFAAQALRLGAHPDSVPEEWRRESRQASTEDFGLQQYVFGYAVRRKRKRDAASGSLTLNSSVQRLQEGFERSQSQSEL
jgi:hypothetical protein